jgi:hypothetical protein
LSFVVLLPRIRSNKPMMDEMITIKVPFGRDQNLDCFHSANNPLRRAIK